MFSFKEALSRAFFYIKIISPLILSSGYLISVQNVLEASFNQQFLYYLLSFVIFIFFFIKDVNSFDGFSLLLLILYLIINLINLFFFENYIGNFIISILFIINVFVYYNVSYSVSVNSKIQIISIVCISLIIASLFSSWIVFYQWMGFANKNDSLNVWVLPAVDVRLSANLAQPNNLATLLCMGIGSVYYFILKFRFCRGLIFTALVIVFTACIFLTGSRTGYLILFLMGGYFFFKKKNFFYAATPMFMLLLWSFTYSWWAHFSGLNFSQIENRGLESGRYLIWKMAVNSITESPWIGYGVGNNIKIFTKEISNNLNYSEGAALSSAHNLFLDLSLNFGVPFSLILLLIFFYICIKALRIKNELGFYAFFCLIPLLAHSFLEYPLSYSFFLIPFSLLLGIFISSSEGGCKIINNIFIKLLYVTIFVVTIFFAKEFDSISIDYKKIRLQSLGVDVPNPYIRKDFCYLDMYCDFLVVNSDSEKEGEDLINKVANYFPTPLTLKKSIEANIKNGNYEISRIQIISYCLIFDIKYCHGVENFIEKNDFSLKKDVDYILKNRGYLK